MTGYKNNQGYTLVEAIVAMGIFVLIATLGAGIFASILRAQTKTVQEQAAASEMRFVQDVVSRDVRQAKSLSCDSPDANGMASAFTLSLKEDGSEPITYALDTSVNPHVITKTQNNVSSPLTDIEITSFQIFCLDVGGSKNLLTVNVKAANVASPFQVSVFPRSGVVQ